MTALHASPTVPALADRDAKFMDEGALHWEIFLVLRDHAAALHGPTTGRTARRQRRIMRYVNAGRRSSMRAAAIREPRFAARPLGLLLGESARKRCRLTIRTAPRHLECVFQPLVLATQPIAFDLGPQQILAQPFDLPRLIVDDLLRVMWRRVGRAPRHAAVMPDLPVEYKKEMRIRALTR
jgi:hypothetical protein